MNKLLSLTFLAIALPLFANEQEAQLDERLNPVIEVGEDVRIDYTSYPSVHLDKNVVRLNNDDWSGLARKYRSALSGDSLFTVVYLGDSHVQADFGGSVLRSRLSQNRSAGRGIIIPFRLAGTNEPRDYSFALTSSFTASKLMRLPRTATLPFTGIGLMPKDRKFTLKISSDTPASLLRFHTCGAGVDISRVIADGEEEQFTSFSDDDGLLCLSLPRPAGEVQVSMCCEDTPVFGGVELRSDSVGVVSHSIGNNGASFSDYMHISGFGNGLSSLHPDLIVVALGTNDAFGRQSMDSLRDNMNSLLDNIHLHNPQAKVLLVGPANCYRKVRRGSRKRRRTTQVVNTRTTEVARTMRLFAEENGIPYYNQYAVAGSAESQRRAHLLSKDGVHYTATGYRLWGNLLSDAILDILNKE